jgi:competence protein ComEC
MKFIRFNLPLLFLLVAAILRMYAYCKTDLLICTEQQLPEEISLGTRADSFFVRIRRSVASSARKYLPSPHSELLLGMTLGIDDLKYVPRFNDMLRQTGTIHVVVVSGYNISLVFGLVMSIIGSRYKLRNLVVAQIITFFYAFISGFDPPVIRSWIMGSVAAWGKFYGRSIDAARILMFSGLVMVLISPLFLFSLSFQLSFLATLSLVLYSGYAEKLVSKYVPFKGVLVEDLIATLAAQVLVWPLISYKFGQVSIISPLVNALILWTVPLATVLGGAFLILVPVSAAIAHILKWIIYMPLDIFVGAIRLFSKVPFASIDFEISLNMLVAYYAVAMLFVFVVSKK